MNWLDLLQWPAMVVTVAAAWLVASTRAYRRNWGFWCFLLGNVLWAVWGLGHRAHALVILQLFLAGLNVRGLRKSRSDPGADAA